MLDYVISCITRFIVGSVGLLAAGVGLCAFVGAGTLGVVPSWSIVAMVVGWLILRSGCRWVDDDECGELLRCPACLEKVRAKACRCPHCGEEVDSPRAPVPEPPTPLLSARVSLASKSSRRLKPRSISGSPPGASEA